MSRKVRIVLMGTLAVLLLLAGAGALGGFVYLKQRNLRFLQGAEEAFAKQDWKAAKRNYAWYLTKHPQDISALEKYAEASLKILDGRTEALRDTARAYFQMAAPNFDNPPLVQRLLEFNEKHRLWEELDYCTQVMLRLHPEDAGLQHYRALALDHQGRAQEAITLYTALADAGTDRMAVYGDLAILLQKQGLAEQAAKIFQQARERFPDEPRLTVQYARFLLQSRQINQAAVEIEPVLERLADDPEAQMTAAQIAIAQKKWEVAVTRLEKARALAPDKPEVYLGLAYAYEAMGAPDKGIALLTELEPALRVDNPEILFSLAEMQYSANLPDTAQETVAAYKRAYPEHYPVFDYFAGRELLLKGAPAEALAKFTAVTKSSPDSIRALYYQAVAYLQLKQNDQAQTALEAYLRARPDDEAARRLLELALGKPRSRQDAEMDVRALLENQNATATTLLLAAKNLIKADKQGDDETVERLVNQAVEQALQREPALPEAHAMLLESALKKKDAAAARASLERAAAAGVSGPALARMQATVSLTAGDLDAATASLEGDLARPQITPGEIFGWSQLFTAHGHLDKGLEILTSAAAKASEQDRLELQLDQVDLCMQAGNTEKAQVLVQALEAVIPKESAAAHQLNLRKLSLASVLLDTEEPENVSQAQALLESVQRQEPEDTGVKVLQARFLLRKNPPDYGPAETIGQGVLQTDPSNVPALLLLHAVAMEKGRLSSALEYAGRAASLAPQDSQVQLAMAEALLRTEHDAEALRILQAVLTSAPHQPRALEMAMQAHGESGRIEEAKAAFQRLEPILTATPEGARKLAFLRTLLCLYEKKWSEAEELLRGPAGAMASDAASVEALARIVTRQGRSEDVALVLRRFV